MRFTTSLAVVGALGLAVLTTGPAVAETAQSAQTLPRVEAVSSKPAVKELKLGLSTYTAKAGTEVTVRAHVDAHARGVTFSSGLFRAKTVQVKGNSGGYGVAEYTFTVPAQADSGSFTVRANAGRYGAKSTTLKVGEVAAIEPRVGMKPEVRRGEQVVVDVVGDLREGNALLSGDAFDRVYRVPLKDQGEGVGRGQVTVTVVKDAKLGYSEVRADFGRWGKAVGSVKVVPAPVPAPSVKLQLNPARVYAGKSFQAGVTTKNVKPGTVVTVKDPGGKQYRAKLNARGAASVKLTVPKDARPGRHSVVATVAGKSSSAQLTVLAVAPKAQVSLTLKPAKVAPGGSYVAQVHTKNVGQGSSAVIVDPQGRHVTVKLNKAGAAAKTFSVPADAKKGVYWVKAYVKDASGSARLTVQPKWSAQSAGSRTPVGGAATGGGLVDSPMTGVALGGVLIAAGTGAALVGRRRRAARQS